MTDRVQAFIVILDDDYRLGDKDTYPSLEGNNIWLPTDADFIAHAIRGIKGVISVEPLIANSEDHIARARVRQELRERLFRVIKETLG